MTIYYSPTTKAFYDMEMGYTSVPEDVIEVSKEEHLELIDSLNVQSKDIRVSSGKITLVDRVLNYTWDDIRAIRDRYLLNSDYTQVPDYTGNTAAWATYRQALRDITETYDDPNSVVWPKKPE